MRRRRLLDEVEEELQDAMGDGSYSGVRAASREERLARAMAITQGGVVLGTLVIFIWGVLTIMRFMM